MEIRASKKYTHESGEWGYHRALGTLTEQEHQAFLDEDTYAMTDVLEKAGFLPFAYSGGPGQAYVSAPTFRLFGTNRIRINQFFGMDV